MQKQTMLPAKLNLRVAKLAYYMAIGHRLRSQMAWQCAAQIKVWAADFFRSPAKRLPKLKAVSGSASSRRRSVAQLQFVPIHHERMLTDIGFDSGAEPEQTNVDLA